MTSMRESRMSSSGSRGASGLLAHDAGACLHQVWPIVLVALAVLIVLMPVSTALIPDVSVFNVEYVHDQMKFRFWLQDATGAVVVSMVLFGAALAFALFRFLLVKRETTAVLSLPITRVRLFAVRFMVCLIALAVVLGLALLVSLMVNVAALGIWEGEFLQCAYVFAGLWLTGSIACAVCAIACAVAGTVAEAVALAVALLGVVSVACFGVGEVFSALLVGFAPGAHLYGSTFEVLPSLMDTFAFANPLLFFAGEAGIHQVFLVEYPVYVPEGGDALLLLGWFVVLVALGLLGGWLLKRRPGERAGIAGLSAVLCIIVCVVAGIAVFGVAFAVLVPIGVGVAIVAAFALFLIVLLLLMNGPFRGPASCGVGNSKGRMRAWLASHRRTVWLMCGETAALACLVVIAASGGLGYSAFVPAADEVESVDISYSGTPAYAAAGFDASRAGDGGFYFSSQYHLDDAEAVEAVRACHSKLAEQGRHSIAAGATVGQDIVPYDVVVSYALNDGSQVVRYFDRASVDCLFEIAQMDSLGQMRDLTQAAITGDVSGLGGQQQLDVADSLARQAFALGDVYVCDRLYATPMLIECDAAAKEELLLAIASDVSSQSVQDRYHPQNACRGVLMFTQAGDTAADSFAYQIEDSLVFLTDEFTQTLGWFQKNELLDCLGVGDDVDNVESLTFQRYAPFSAMNAYDTPMSQLFIGYKADNDQQYIVQQDFGKRYSTDDATELAELVPLLQNTYFMNEPGYLVCVELKGTQGSEQTWSYMFLPESAAPDWLMRVAG